MAILLPTPYSYRSNNREAHFIARKRNLIPVISNKNKCANELEFEVFPGEDGTLVRLYARIDIDSSPALRDCLVALLQAPHAKAVSVDLSAVTHIDSAGVATLIEALRIARVHKTQLRLQGLEGRLLRLFGSTGILAMFDADPRNNGECGSRAV